ncbi:TonB family protein [Planctobacterium marinum]|uniref:TonB C-terminal domain-containing protein n=1 Tax=Planctobacterium marinum TaxID=1631968 RepID=A0AA48HI81_9ALTE|nr:hypothetical protein MACH26_29090 [Planctobacterium marinum]
MLTTKKTFTLSTVSLLLCISALSAAANADQAQSAKLISETSPVFPFEYRKAEIEGWVQLSYVVDEQGKVKDTLIHDSTGHALFEQSALQAVQKWQYQPANVNGTPVPQSFNAVTLNFRLDNSNNYDDNQRSTDVNKRFLSRFQKGMNAIEKGNLKDAAKKIKQLRERDKRKWIESSYLWVLEGYYFEKQGDTVNAAKSFAKVMHNGSDVLPRAVYVEVLKKAFIANIMNNNLSEAVTVYETFESFAADHEALKNLAPYYQQAKDFLNGEQPLEVVGVLPQVGLWHHKISKSELLLSSAENPLDAVHLRCDHQQVEYQKVIQQSINIEPHWGQCVVYVEGVAGTQFLVTES